MPVLHGSLTAGPFDVACWTTAPLRLEQAVWLPAVPAAVFALLSNHEALPRLFVWIHRVMVDNSHAIVPGGLGARRICLFGDDMILEEIIVGWDPPHLYAYAGVDATHPFGMTGHVGIIQCAASGTDGTLMRWQQFFDHPHLIAMQTQLDRSLHAAMRNLLCYFNHTAAASTPRKEHQQ
jgi:Polyketide cyclase / dehydrase and lipid transport